MENKASPDTVTAQLTSWATRSVGTIEAFSYIVLGILLAAAVVLGIGGAAVTLWEATLEHGEGQFLVLAIDRLLFVLMIVEILHTVRVSFNAGELNCEPFLIVGLIATIRRMLVITLESSQAHQPGHWTADLQSSLNATMTELVVLGLLILVMVFSIYLLRRSRLARTPPVK
jgi:uncharacterized membrane protein (DUF373 family)